MKGWGRSGWKNITGGCKVVILTKMLCNGCRTTRIPVSEGPVAQGTSGRRHKLRSSQVEPAQNRREDTVTRNQGFRCSQKSARRTMATRHDCGSDTLGPFRVRDVVHVSMVCSHIENQIQSHCSLTEGRKAKWQQCSVVIVW